MDFEKNLGGIVARAQQKDPAALAEIFDFFFEPVFRFIFFRTKNRADAEDLTHEVFLRIFEKIEKFKFTEKVSFAAWVFRIARNLVIDFYRKKREVLEIPDDEIDENSTEDLQEKTTNFFERKRLKVALQKIPAAQRDCLELKFFAELKNEEIAQTLKKTDIAVRTSISRGLKKLKQILDNF